MLSNWRLVECGRIEAKPVAHNLYKFIGLWLLINSHIVIVSTLTKPLECITTSEMLPGTYPAPNQITTGRLWRWLAAAAIVGNVGIVYYANVHSFAGHTLGMVSAKYPILLEPAGYAFSIEGFIFLTLMVYAVWQLLPAQQKMLLPDALAQPLTFACIATAAWTVLVTHELILSSMGMMLLILSSLIVTYSRVRRRIFSGAAPVLVGVPFSLYLSWVSVVAVINITIGLRQFGLQTAEGASVALTMGLILGMVALGLLMSRAFRDLVFPVVVAWALVAVWVVRLREVPALGWVALLGATVVALFGIGFSRIGGRKTPSQVRDEAAAVIEAEIAARKIMRSGQ